MNQRLRRNSPTLLLLAILLVLTSIATYWQLEQASKQPALSTLSAEPDGARALMLWTEALAYEATSTLSAEYDVPRDSDMVFVLEPQLPGISAEAWQTLQAWVESGGTLFLVGEGFGTAASMQHLEFEVNYRENGSDDVFHTPEGTLAVDPTVLQNVRPRAVLNSDRTDYKQLLLAGDDVVLAEIRRGDGSIFLSTLAYPFTNRGLKDNGNAEFVLSILELANDAQTVWFDEWHHGQRATMANGPSGPGHWLRATRPGQAIIYAGISAFIWLLLTGQRFGKPLPLRQERQRRSSVEHVVALARLLRRADHRKDVQNHYHEELKRKLGQRYGLSSRLEDDVFIERLSNARPDLDVQRLKILLKALSDEKISEQRMLQTTKEASEWMTL